LAGYTSLIYEIKEVLEDLELNKYKRVKVKSNSIEENALEDAMDGSPSNV